MSNDRIELTIKNWEKYNPRKDVKQASWFRLQNDLFDDHELFSLTSTELAFLVYLFCLASKKNNENVVVSIAHATAIGRFDQASIHSALQKLDESKTIILSATSRARYAYGTRSPATDVRTGTNVTDERDGRVKSKTSTPTARAVSLPTPVTEIKNFFFDSYRKEFNREYPGWGAKENTQAKNWLRSVSLEKAKELIELYPKWNKPFVVKTGHPFGLLTTDYVELEAWAKGHKQLVQKIAKGTAVQTIEVKRAVEKEEMNHAAEIRTNGSDQNFSGRSQPELSDETERIVSGPRVRLF